LLQKCVATGTKEAFLFTYRMWKLFTQVRMHSASS
jgi:hypothetical protein